MQLKLIRKKIWKRIRERWYTLRYTLTGYVPENIGKSLGTRILIYHGVCRSDALKFNARFLTEKQFEEHLIALKKCYNILSFADYTEDNLSTEKLNVLLTFDDGLKNNFQYALPLLLKYKIPALFFVTSSKEPLFNDVLDVFSLIGPASIRIRGSEFTKVKHYLHYRYKNAEGQFLAGYFHATNDTERHEIVRQIYQYIPEKEFRKYDEYISLMTQNELKKMSAQPGITLGSHGSSHADLSVLSLSDLEIELEESKSYLEETTGESCPLIAFPYGGYDQKTLETCYKAGYKYIFGTEKLLAPEDRKVVIERFTVNPFISAINQMYYIAKNKYE